MDFKWMDERVEKLPGNNKIYRFVCFMLGRRNKKLTYKELFLLFRTINKRKLGLAKSNEKSFKKIIEIYKFQNGKVPEEYHE